MPRAKKVTASHYKESGASRATNISPTLDGGTPKRGMKPLEHMVDKNQLGFHDEFVDIPPTSLRDESHSAITEEDKGGAKDELDQTQRRHKTPDPATSCSSLIYSPPVKSGKPP